MIKKFLYILVLLPYLPFALIGFIAGMISINFYCGFIWADRLVRKGMDL